MIDETPLLKELHSLYCSLTGLVLSFDMNKLQLWQNWRSHGWSKEELSLVVRFLGKEIQKEKRWRTSLYFRNLIANTDAFEEFLADARARGRVVVMDPGKRDVLYATGRLEDQKARPRSAAEILRDAKAFEDFKTFARSL